MDASIETLARVQSDFDNYLRWYFATLEVKFLRKVSDREYIYYMVHDAPIGTPDRDVILRTVIEPMTDRKPYVFMRVTALPNYSPPRPPYVRMVAENYTVKWTPIDANTTLVESEGFINPGGNAPAWTVNFIQSKGPYANMMGLARQAKLPQYSEATTPLPFTLFNRLGFDSAQPAEMCSLSGVEGQFIYRLPLKTIYLTHLTPLPDKLRPLLDN